MAINVPEPIVPPLKDIAYFGGSLVEFSDFAHKRAPIIWPVVDIPGLHDLWILRKWGAAVADFLPDNHPGIDEFGVPLAGQFFEKGLVADFFDDAQFFFNQGIPNAVNDHLLMGDVIIGKDIEGNIVRLVITEQHEIAAQGLIRP